MDKFTILERFSFLRLGDWFNKHASLLVSILIVDLASSKNYGTELLATMVFSIASFCYAFGLNYYLEREIDEQVGKNRVKGIGKKTAIILFALLAALMFIVPILMRNGVALLIALYYFTMATLYSVQPIYLKARGVLSVLSQAAFLLVPQFLFFVSLISSTHIWLIIYLSVWLTLITAKGATIHQIIDYENDLRTGLRTLAVLYGKERTIQFVQILVSAILLSSLVGLLLFEFPINAIAFLVVAFSNPKYKKPLNK